jgi:hypothetical protein
MQQQKQQQVVQQQVVQQQVLQKKTRLKQQQQQQQQVHHMGQQVCNMQPDKGVQRGSLRSKKALASLGALQYAGYNALHYIPLHASCAAGVIGSAAACKASGKAAGAELVEKHARGAAAAAVGSCMQGAKTASGAAAMGKAAAAAGGAAPVDNRLPSASTALPVVVKPQHGGLGLVLVPQQRLAASCRSSTQAQPARHCVQMQQRLVAARRSTAQAQPARHCA